MFFTWSGLDIKFVQIVCFANDILVFVTLSHIENGRDVILFFMLGLKRTSHTLLSSGHRKQLQKGAVKMLACL